MQVLALESGWRKALHRVDRRPVGALAGAYDGTDLDWAEWEQCRAGHTDGRVRELAAACPDTRVVSVCDREGDSRDVLAHAVDDGDALLVRASRSAQQRVTVPGGGKECLWEHVAARPPAASTDLTIPAAGGPRARKERIARLEIRTAEVEIVPPRRDRIADPLPMFAVSATETGADGDDPLHWLLLTTERPAEGEADAVHAATVLGWYRLRWTIEAWCSEP